MTDRSTRLTAVLAAVVAVLAVVALLVTSYRSGGDEEPQADSTPARVGGRPAPAGPGGTDQGPEPTPPDEGGDHEHGELETPSPATIADIKDVTTKFLKAWQEPGSPKQRTDALAPYATESLAEQLSNVDPANLPTAKLQGEPDVPEATQNAAETVTTFSDGLQVQCSLVLSIDGWRVTKLLPVEDTSESDTSEGASGDSDKEP